MNSLLFLNLRSAKNRLLELRRNPKKLALYSVALAIIIFLLVITLVTNNEGGNPADLLWLKGALFALLLFLYPFAIYQGLSQGSAIFTMSDVNFLFVSPVNSRATLIYGVSRTVKTSLLVSLFIPFQSSNLKRGFGVGMSGMWIILFSYMLFMIASQLTSLLIYSYSNGNKKRQAAVKALAAALLLPAAVSVLLSVKSCGWDWASGALAALNSPAVTYTPLIGWVSHGAYSLIAGDIASGLFFLGLTLGFGALIIVVIFVTTPDYYEDVLVAAQTAFETKRAASEGKVSLESASKRKIKVRGTGVSGYGASALFYKHLRESFRANRLGLWGLPTVCFVAGAAIFSVIMRGAGDTNSDIGIIIMTSVLMWIQIIFIGMGRGLKELYTHYVYMIPSNPFVKMIWSNMETVLKVSVESALIFITAGAILGASPLMAAVGALNYALFSVMLIAVNYVSLRFIGADLGAGILVTLYYIAVVIIMLPGVVAAAVAGGMLNSALAAFGILALWEAVVAAACFALSMGILHKCDMPVTRPLSGM